MRRALQVIPPRSVGASVGVGAFGAGLVELQNIGVRPDTFSQLQRPWLWDAEGPKLSADARRRLGPLGLCVPILGERRTSSDGSTKLLVAFGEDGVEAVHMPRAIGSGRVTLCISSQVGCAMGCVFCATASMGFRRQLTAAEMVAQVLSIVRALGPRHPGALTLVLMGMGEPLHNLPEVARAIQILCHPLGLGISPRRITVSTSGLVPQIDALGRIEPRPLLALSLNATTDAARRALMPVAGHYSLVELKASLERFPLRRRERITIEYVLLDTVNDSVEDARRLSDFCASFPHQINLIPFNEHSRAEFRSPSEAKLNQFASAILACRPTLLSVRRSRGRDVQAACGQLVQ